MYGSLLIQFILNGILICWGSSQSSKMGWILIFVLKTFLRKCDKRACSWSWRSPGYHIYPDPLTQFSSFLELRNTVGFYSIHCDSWICCKCRWKQLSINTKGENQGPGIYTFTKAIAGSLTESTEPLRLFYGHHMWATCQQVMY